MNNEFGILELNTLRVIMDNVVANAVKDSERYGGDPLGTIEKSIALRDKIQTMLEAKCDEADKAMRQLKADRLKYNVSETAKGLGCNDDEVAFFVSILD